MAKPEKSKSSLRKTNPALKKGLSVFHGIWSLIDMTTDYAIFKFLNVTPEQAHLITAGMMYGRKARLLADLVGRSDHPNKAKILGALNWIRGNSKRDIIAHGYQKFDDESIEFVERTISGEFEARGHVFTNEEFISHIKTLAKKGREFQEALEASEDDLREFANAAFNLNRKAKTSPG